jgi:hypothetical protein
MSNTALSSARRRRTGPAVPVMAATTQQQQQQQQQLQQQRLLEIQRQKQLLLQQPSPSQQLQTPQPQQTPYTQRMQAPMQSPMQRIPTPQVQIVKADTPVPPGYIKLLMPNGVYQMESVETGSINFPYAEPHLAPTLILRNHDLDIIKLQGYHNDVSNQLAHLTTLVTRATSNPVRNDTSTTGTGIDVGSAVDAEDDGGIEEQEIVFDEAVIHKITESPAFIANTVSHIMQNTNLSELVTEVNAVKTENRELRSILNSQHEMMNAMNLLLFKLLNKMHSSSDDHIQTDPTEQVESADTMPIETQESQLSQEYKKNELLSTIEEEDSSPSPSSSSNINTETVPAETSENIPRDWLP